MVLVRDFLNSVSIWRQNVNAVLSLQDKLKIVELIDTGYSYQYVASKFGIGKSTVFDIWKARNKVSRFVAELEDCSSKGAKKRCMIRKLNYEDVDKALHLWLQY